VAGCEVIKNDFLFFISFEFSNFTRGDALRVSEIPVGATTNYQICALVVNSWPNPKAYILVKYGIKCNFMQAQSSTHCATLLTRQ
jgi:hypothetical protein